MKESLRILVVGSDADHDLSKVTNDFTARGWTPQIVRMTRAEWRLRSVGDYVDCLLAVREGAVPAELKLLADGRYPIAAPNSKYFFHLDSAYTQLRSQNDAGGLNAIVAQAIIADYLHSEESPLVAVVLSEEAWNWIEVKDVWLDQFPPDTVIWLMRSDGTTEIVRCVGTADVNI